MAPGTKHFDEKMSSKDGDALQQVASIGDATLTELNENRNGQFHRSFTPRQVHVCASLPSCSSCRVG
jgi:hypothetical protein